MKIAIVGAGISGVYIANRLKSMGHNVTVFEKTDRIGGYCYNYVDENNIGYPMSAMFILKRYHHDKNIIMDLAKKFQIDLVTNKSVFYKDNDYKLTIPKIIAIQGGFVIYALMYFIHTYIYRFGYINLCSLKKFGMREFLKIIKFEKMSLIGMEDENYDIRNNLASPVVFIGILLNLLMNSSSVLFLNDDSFVGIINKLAEDIDIKLNTQIESIKRTDDKIYINYNQFNKPVVEIYDKLIIATYPHEILEIINDVSEIEKNYLLSETVGTHVGYTFLCDIEWKKEPYIFIKKADYTTAKFIYCSKVKQYYVLGIIPYDNTSPENLIPTFVNDNDGIFKKIIFHRKFTNYKLFYRNTDMRDYINNKLQGHKNTFYVGTLLSTSGLTNSILNHCEFVLKKINNIHFSNN